MSKRATSDNTLGNEEKEVYMSSTAFQDIVEPFFKEAEIPYEIHSDGTILYWMLRAPEFNLQCGVRNYQQMDLLSLGFWNIATGFGPSDCDALQLCNRLNVERVGKFVIDREGRVDYEIELLVNENTNTDDFARALSRGASTVSTTYEEWMKLRWGEKRRGTRRKSSNGRQKTVEDQKTVEEMTEAEEVSQGD